jgi:hypothetical protein
MVLSMYNLSPYIDTFFRLLTSSSRQSAAMEGVVVESQKPKKTTVSSTRGRVLKMHDKSPSKLLKMEQ